MRLRPVHACIGQRGISFKARRLGLGAFECTVGLAPMIGVIGVGDSSHDAVHTAASLAAKLSDGLNSNPDLAAILPPGTGVALKGIALASGLLAKGEDDPDVKRALKGAGDAATSVARSIASLF